MEKYFTPQVEVEKSDLELGKCSNCGTEVILDEAEGECYSCRENIDQGMDEEE